MKVQTSQHFLSRRSFIASVVAAERVVSWENGATQASPHGAALPLNSGFEIRDYRLFPTSDVRRFIVEIYNTSDIPISTPSLGVILPHLPEQLGFGFAVPTSAVLHPRTSGVLIGVAPLGLLDDDNWGTPEWVLCNEVSGRMPPRFEDLDIALATEIYRPVDTDVYAEVVVWATNLGSRGAGDFTLNGDVFDRTSRVCGILLPWTATWIEAGETQQISIVLEPDLDYIGNPFALVRELNDITVQVTVQPLSWYEPLQCPAVMPWNR